MKIVVLGAGSLGSALGGRLSEAGHEVWLISRNASHVQAVQTQGLVLLEGGVARTVRPRACTQAQAVDLASGPVDLLVVLVKSQHTEPAMQSALGLVSHRTAVLSLQNGLGHEDVLSRLVGRRQVLAGKTYVGGVLTAPGQVTVGAEGKETLVGELAADRDAPAHPARLTRPSVQAVAKAFRQAGLATQVSPDIMGTIWDKLFVNVATGALSGITGLNYGALYAQPQIEACALAAVAEAMAVARAAGVAVCTPEPRVAWVKAAAGLPPEFRASMLQSLDKGLATEIDFVNGAVVAEGRKYGVPTPVNQALVACIKGIEQQRGLST